MDMDYRQAVVKDGNLIEVVNVIEDKIEYYELKQGEILVDDLKFQGMLKPFWDGEKWIDDLTAQEVDEMEWEEYLNSLKPSEEEIKNAQLELVILNLLIDMEVM